MLRPASLVLAALSPLIVCADQPLPDQLSANRAKWDALSISSYRFTFWEHHGWFAPSPVGIVVRDGMVVSSRYLRYAFRPGRDLEFDITEVEDADVSSRDSMPELFELVSRYLDDSGARIEIRFHPDYGFPMQFSYDLPNAHDEEHSFEVSDFVILE
jgi:hypothetical protein